MARTINRLTARQVSTIGTPGMHADGGGLYLFVEASGARRWTFVFRWAGRRAEMGLGPTLATSLARARELAQAARADVKAGVNPIEKRRVDRAAAVTMTFGEACDALIAALEPAWKSGVHARQWRTTLTVDAAALRPLDVRGVTTEDVLGVLKPIWLEKPDTAARLRGRIERVLDYAKVLKRREGENPARWRGHLVHLLPKRHKLSRGHHAAMAIDALPDFMAELRERFDGQQRQARVARCALEFTILTAARTGESIAAHTSEFDRAGGFWIVGADRMKMGVEHRVPLSKAALAVVAACWPAKDGYLFAGLKPGTHLSNMAMLALLQKDLGRKAATVHGFRSTFKDWATERTRFEGELSEIALAHKVGDDTELAYRRGDMVEKRRRLMEAWAGFCAGGDGRKVVTLNRA